MCRAAAKEIALLVRPSRKKPAGCTLLLPAADEPPGILANNFLQSLESCLQNTGSCFYPAGCFSGKKVRAAAPRAGGLFVSVGRGLDGGRGRRGSGLGRDWPGSVGLLRPRPWCQAQPASRSRGNDLCSPWGRAPSGHRNMWQHQQII